MQTSTDIKHINELRIFCGDIEAGILKRTSKGCEIVFSNQFLEDAQHDSLTYCIPKQRNSYFHYGFNLPPFFAGLLPEGLRLKALVDQLKTSEDDLFSLLAASGERVIGDIYTVADKLILSPANIPDFKDVDFYDFFSTQMQEGFLVDGNEGFAGVQEKISASMISFPIHVAKKNKSYILKLNPKDKSNLVQNEFQCLKLAKKSGLDVNNATLVYDKNENPGLLIERFDRISYEEDIVCKLHQEDACQFLDIYPADKYRISYQEVCSGIQNLATAPQIEIMKAIQLYAFSYIIGNGDLHAKNISLQTEYKTKRVRLTPAYDLICTYIYGDHKMALKLDGRDENFKRKNMIEFGARFEVKEKAIHQTLDKMIDKVRKNQELLYNIPGINEKKQNLLKTMLNRRINKLSGENL